MVLIILLCVIGSGMYAANRHGMHFAPFGNTGIEMFGEQYDYRIRPSEKPATGAVHVVFDNLRGNVRVTGSDEPEIKVDEHKMIRAFNKADADQADRETPLEIVTEGDRVVVRTNQENASHARRISLRSGSDGAARREPSKAAAATAITTSPTSPAAWISPAATPACG